LYLDRSSSIGRQQKKYLAEKLGTIFREDRSPIAQNRSIFLIPFADRVGEAVKIKEGDPEPQILAFLERTDDRQEDGTLLDRQQSNIINALEDMEQISGAPSIKQTHAVFILASDFAHDSTAGDRPEDRRADADDWRERSGTLIGELAEKFASQGGPVLLLLPVLQESGNSSDLAGEVLWDLRQLAPYDSVVSPLGQGRLDLSSFIRYLKPLSITTRMTAEGLVIEVTDRACFSLPELIINANGTRNLCTLNEKNEKCSMIVRDVKGGDRAHPSLNDVLVTVEIAKSDRRMPSIVTEREVNIDEYVFLTRWTAHFGALNRNLEGSAQTREVLWRNPRAGLSFDLLDGSTRIGKGTLRDYIEKDDDLSPHVSPHKEFTMELTGGNLPKLCYEGGDDRLKLAIATTPDGLQLQHEPLKVNILRNDEQSDLLEDLVHHGSLPALATVLTVLAMIIRRRDVGMEYIHAVLGAAAFWLILFLLVHRIPLMANLIDYFFVDNLARWVGLIISIFLAWTGFLMISKGVITPAISKAEALLDLASEEMRARDRHQKGLNVTSTSHPLRRERWYSYGRLLILVVAPLIIGLWLFFGKATPDCTFEVRDSLSAYEINGTEGNIVAGAKP
jgi:hypothetical protein